MQPEYLMPVILGSAGEWAPLVGALAGFVALQGPAVANLIITLANRNKLEQVHQNTNGSLDALREQVAALTAANAALQGEVDRLLRPPGPV